MDPRLIIVAAYPRRIRRRCASPNTIMWSRHSRRIEPMSLSTQAFCQGDRGAIGWSRMPIARIRCKKTRPYEVRVERKVESTATYKKELVALFDINQRRRRGFDPC